MLESIISFSSLYWISYFLWIYSQISITSSKIQNFLEKTTFEEFVDKSTNKFIENK